MPSVLTPPEVAAALAVLPGAYRANPGQLTITARCDGFQSAVDLITSVAGVAETMGHHPDVDLRWDTVHFTLATHSQGGITKLDLELARRILDLADKAGADLLPPRERTTIAIDAADPDAIRDFWATGLGYAEQDDEDDVVLRSPSGGSSMVWFQRMTEPRPGRNRFHLDVYVDERTVRARVDATLAAGGTLVTDRFAPGWWVLADAEGNELCICSAS